MARPRKVDRTVDVHIMLPMSLVVEVETMLFSDLQQRIPLGARAKFYESAVREYLARLEKEKANAQA